ncbi:TPA: hypothetical protein I2T90_11570 [Staphylococcus aureus]|nr:hypothetical protein UC16_01955 [Staphylococcus aureus]ATZ15811.1 hypothetical protein CU118_13405 [Staphylococcus aureus]MCO4458043.1 hypothetical protein [Staphylococcus aureus]MSN56345.1 hypothetical protein [Staphylococcus aureus]MSN62359.1 hypothetical protein [Staphylococcus aureus]
MEYVRDIVKWGSTNGDFRMDREFKTNKKASNSNKLLDAQRGALVKMLCHKIFLKMKNFYQ